MRKDTISGGSSEYVELKLMDDSSNVRFLMGIGSTDKAYVGVGLSGAVYSSNTVATKETYFLVAKIVSKASGNDEAYLKVYGPGDNLDASEPAGWTITTNSATSANLTQTFLQIGANITAGGMIDEIRIGSDWTDVVPENPSMLLEYEGFDYSGTTISNKSGGIGWGGVWDDADNDLNLSNDGISLESSALLLTNTGSRILDTNGGEAFRDLGVIVDMGQNITEYFGILLRKDTTSGSSNEYIEISFVDYANVKKFLFGIGSDDKFYLDAGGDGNTKSSILATAGDTYFIVVKLVTSSSGNDEAFLKVYDPGSIMGQSEPTGAEWTVTDTGNTAARLFRIQMQVGNNIIAGGMIDEFRIGKTWESVAPAPPQGTVVTIK